MRALLKPVIIPILTLILIELAFRVVYFVNNQTPDELKRGKAFEKIEYLMRPTLHPHKGFILHPHLDVIFKGASLKSNSLGYPDKEFQRKKSKEKFRIIGIGDSVMMGWAVDKSYLSLLENKTCGDKKIETFNMAIAGQSAEQQPYLYYDALSYQPDLIIMDYVGNDWINEATPREEAPFLSPSFAMNFIVTSLLGEKPLWKPYKEYPFGKPIGLPASYTLMSKLGRTTSTLVVMDSRYESELSSHHDSEKLFQTLGMKTINLLEEWNQQAKGKPGFSAVRTQNSHNQDFLIANDFHPNQKWHERVAERIHEELGKSSCQD